MRPFVYLPMNWTAWAGVTMGMPWHVPPNPRRRWRRSLLPLGCPICHSQMRIIALINDAGTVNKILDHIGESTRPLRIAPARGPPLWEAAAAAEQAKNDPQWDSSAQPAPEIEFDQRIAWQVRAGAKTRQAAARQGEARA